MCEVINNFAILYEMELEQNNKIQVNEWDEKNKIILMINTLIDRENQKAIMMMKKNYE